MWLIVPLIVLLLFVIIGSGIVGGIYAAVLIPIVVIIAVGVGVSVMLRRSRGRPAREPGRAGWAPTPGGGSESGAGGGSESGAAASGGAGAATPAEPATPEDILQERQGG